jgi:septal ring factor EnvC (AmiA/AmiB activator)
MQKKILFIAFIFAALPWASIHAQTQDRTALEKERQEIQQEIKEIQSAYNKVKGQSKQALGQLSMLNRKIQLQERYISSINKELRMLDDDLYLSNLEIYRLQKQMDTLKSEYARTVVYAYKNRSSYDYLNFLFSASSFNDAIRRASYLKSYRAYREKQVKTILETKELIAKRQQQQLVRKEQKNSALQNQTKEKTVLDVQKNEKGAVLGKLKSQEKDLQKQINAKKKRDKELNNAISGIVRREIEAAKKEAEAIAKAAAKKADAEAKNNPPVASNPNTTVTPTTPKVTTTPAKKPASYLELNAKDVALGSSFMGSRGKLPWPVDNGVVTIHFGPYKIDNTLLSGDNPGITITTPVGTTVKSVFDGDVVGVYNMGDGMAITIRHGKYFTTYSNLSSTSVKKGDPVKTGQAIGRAGRDEDSGSGQIDFILMIETKNVNPEPWLRR